MVCLIPSKATKHEIYIARVNTSNVHIMKLTTSNKKTQEIPFDFSVQNQVREMLQVLLGWKLFFNVTLHFKLSAVYLICSTYDSKVLSSGDKRGVISM